jgi:hypothetical protein
MLWTERREDKVRGDCTMQLARPVVLSRTGNLVRVRIPSAAFRGVNVPKDPAVIGFEGLESVELFVSPAVERGIRALHPILSDPERLAEASFVAHVRHQYIWDVGVAIADGANADREAVRQWRRENKVGRPSSEWPAGWPEDAEALVAEAREVFADMRTHSKE